MNKPPKKNGFTLIELVMVMGLMGLVLTLAATVQLSGLRAYRRETTISQAQGGLEVAIADITRSLRNTLPENVSGYENGLVADGNVYQCRDKSLFKNGDWLAGSIEALSSTLDGQQVTVRLTLETGDIREIVMNLRR